MTQLIALIDLFTFAVSSVLGVYVFLRAPKKPIFRAFGLTILGIVGWNLSIFLLITGIGDPLIPGKLAFSFGTLLGSGFLHFAFLYPVPSRGNRAVSWILGILGTAFFIIPLLPVFVHHIEIVNGTITGDLNPTLFGLWSLYYFIVLFFTMGFLAVKTVLTKGIGRLHLSQVLLGFALFLIPSIFTNALLPLLWNDYRWNNLGPAFTIFLAMFVAHAILSYRLLDIRWVLGKSVLITVVTTIVGAILSTFYLFVSGLIVGDYALMTAGLLIAVTFEPIIHFVNKLVNRVLNHGFYDPAAAMKEIAEIERKYTDVEVLLAELLTLFDRSFSTEQIALVLFRYNTTEPLSIREKNFASVESSVGALATIAKAANFQILEAGELAWKQEFMAYAMKPEEKRWLATMRKAGVEQIIPFFVDQRAVGLMVFGKRHLDRSLRNQDVDFLNTVRSTISPALENASKFEEMRRLYAELEKLDQAKTDFVGVVSHRFRTPLTAIRWSMEGAMDELPPKASSDLKMELKDTDDRALFLVRTLDQLLDTLAVESDKLALHVEKIDIKATLAKKFKEMVGPMREKGLRVTSSLAVLSAKVDPKYFLLMCENLLDNAMRYTADGGKIRCELTKEKGALVFCVKDSGIGIPKKEQEKIFEKFFRAKNGILTYTDGSGLGLYLSRHIARLHGGDITFISDEGKGATFTLTIPM